MLEWFLVAIPPTTLVTALAFWFGYNYTTARTYYLGVDSNMLEYSTTDYLLRSAEPVIVPIAVLLVISLLALIVHGLTGYLMQKWPNVSVLRITFLTLIALGSLSIALAIRSMFVFLGGHYLLPAILLGGGAAVTGYAFYMLRTSDSLRIRKTQDDVPSWERGGYVIVALLVILSLFWGITLYAGALGQGRAQELEQNLAQRPAVKIYSKKSLALLLPAITETRLNFAESEYRFQYSGLRLLVHSAGKYFLLPENWTHESGTALVLEDNSDMRLEFTPGQP